MISFNKKYKKLLDLDHRFNPSFHHREGQLNYIHWKMTLANLNKDSIDISVNHDVMTVRGRTEIMLSAEDQSLQISGRGIPFNFHMVLPQGFQSEGISTQIEKDTLLASIPVDRSDKGSQK